MSYSPDAPVVTLQTASEESLAAQHQLLLARCDEVAERLSQLGSQLREAGLYMQQMAAPPDEETIQAAIDVREDFLALVESVQRCVHGVGVAIPAGSPANVVALREMLQSLEPVLHQRAALAVVDKVLGLACPVDPFLPALADCKAEARRLRAHLEQQTGEEIAVAALLTNGTHPLAQLLRLVEPVGLSILERSELQTSVDTMFDRPLSVSALAGLLVTGSDLTSVKETRQEPGVEPKPPDDPLQGRADDEFAVQLAPQAASFETDVDQPSVKQEFDEPTNEPPTEEAIEAAAVVQPSGEFVQPASTSPEEVLPALEVPEQPTIGEVADEPETEEHNEAGSPKVRTPAKASGMPREEKQQEMEVAHLEAPEPLPPTTPSPRINPHELALQVVVQAGSRWHTLNRAHLAAMWLETSGSLSPVQSDLLVLAHTAFAPEWYEPSDDAAERFACVLDSVHTDAILGKPGAENLWSVGAGLCLLQGLHSGLMWFHDSRLVADAPSPYQHIFDVLREYYNTTGQPVTYLTRHHYAKERDPGQSELSRQNAAKTLQKMFRRQQKYPLGKRLMPHIERQLRWLEDALDQQTSEGMQRVSHWVHDFDARGLLDSWTDEVWPNHPSGVTGGSREALLRDLRQIRRDLQSWLQGSPLDGTDIIPETHLQALENLRGTLETEGDVWLAPGRAGSHGLLVDLLVHALAEVFAVDLQTA